MEAQQYVQTPYAALTLLSSSTLRQAKDFLDDYQRATQVSSEFDMRISDAGNDISPEYADILALSARQLMASLDITLSRTSGGVWNLTDTKIFMKNLGAGGSDAGSSGYVISLTP